MARKGRKKKKQPKESGGGGWITTFSDLMSLLLTFFILLFSMSTVNEEKFSAASQSVKNAFIGEGAGAGILDGGLIDNEEADTGDGAADEDDGLDIEDEISENNIPQAIKEMYAEAMSLIESEGIEEQVTVSIDQDGIYLDIQESILFQSGEADLKAGGKGTLDSLIEVLTINDNDLVIEGYTDDVPIQSEEFPSNWELSTDRALSVVHYLAEEKGVDPSRLSARGYGEYSPVVPNDSPENRAKNRRVNIVLVYQPEEEE